MAFLNVNAWVTYPKANFWATKWDVVSSLGTILTVAFLALYPVYGSIKIYKNLNRLDDP